MRDVIFKGIRWQSLSNLTNKAVVPLLYLVLGRLLVPEDFGALAIVWVFIGLSEILVDVGLSYSIIQKKEVDEGHLSTSFTINVILGIFLIGILWVSSPYLSNWFKMELTSYLRVISIIFLVNGFVAVQKALFNKELLFKKIAAISLVETAVYATGTLTLIGYGIWSIILGRVASVTVSCLLFWVASDWKPKRLGVDKEKFLELFSFGSGVLLNKLVGRLSNIDTIVIGKLMDAYSLGLYNMANRMITVLYQTPMDIVNKVMFPVFSKAQEDKEKLAKLYLQTIRYVALVGIPIPVLFIVVGRELVLALLTEKWVDVVPIIKVLCIFSITSIIGGGLWGSFLYSMGQSYKVFKLTVLRMVFLPIFLVAGILSYGLIGGAWGIVAYSIIFRVIYQHIINKSVGLKMRQYAEALVPSFTGASIAYMWVNLYNITLPSLGLYADLVAKLVIGGGMYVLVIRFMFEADYKVVMELVKRGR